MIVIREKEKMQQKRLDWFFENETAATLMQSRFKNQARKIPLFLKSF